MQLKWLSEDKTRSSDMHAELSKEAYRTRRLRTLKLYGTEFLESDAGIRKQCWVENY